MIKLYIGYHKYNLELKNIYYLEDTVTLKAFFSYTTLKSLISKYKDAKCYIFQKDINYDYIIKEYNSIKELEFDYLQELIWNYIKIIEIDIT